MSIVSNGQLIVAAIASRPYVQAAVEAGYEVVAIDAFADADMQTLATCCYQIDLCEGQLDHNQLLSVLDNLALDQFVGFCYGAGFEKAPTILSLIHKRVTVLGNLAEVVKCCKAPNVFFELCRQLQLPFPVVMNERPVEGHGWIQKTIGGSGGGHIQPLTDVQNNQVTEVYYQKVQAGLAISCLFVASKSGVEVIGFNELWVDVNESTPFRYGGAVSHVEINEEAKARFTRYVTKLSQVMGLVGINSCDAICDDNDIYLLEVNPRLSATMDLYTDRLLMEKHIAACQHQGDANEMKLNRAGDTCKAHQVLYADRSLTLKEDIIWPEWICDVPMTGSSFSDGMPVCTVIAEAKTAALAKTLVNERALLLKSELLN